MAGTTPRLLLLELVNNGGNHVTRVNNALRWLDAFAGGTSVIDRDLTAPPGSPAEGDLYIPTATATGDWTSHEGDFAFYINGAWSFVTPLEGFLIWLEDENVALRYDGTTWNETSHSVDPGVSATGTTQGAGYVITKRVTEVTAITAASAEAATLPTARVGDQRIVTNDDAADTLQLFPASGDEIDAPGTDAVYTLAPNKTVILYAVTAARWVAVLTA